MGTERAAQTLIDSVSETNRKVDVMIFPFVFCWRQCLELRIKKIISCGRILKDKDADFPATHDIQRLWGEARAVLESVETAIPEYDAVRDVVQEFADMDPDSFSFRYPMKKDRTATVPPGTPNLNWAQFHATMSAVANFLEAAQCELDVRVDYVIDRNAEASRNEYS